MINQAVLLKIIEVNGSLSPLLKRGLTHSQIALLMQEQIDCGNVISDENGVHITNLGSVYLKKILRKLDLKEKDTWILPQEVYYRKPISMADIVLPRKSHKRV